MLDKNNKSKIQIFKNSWFKRFAQRNKISDKALKESIIEAQKGNIDANLGGYVIKQRISRSNQGKSGGYRTIIIFKKGNKAFFVYGFSKSEKDNIDKGEVNIYKKAAKELLALSDDKIKKLIKNGALTEIK